jgi:hypothetical protein
MRKGRLNFSGRRQKAASSGRPFHFRQARDAALARRVIGRLRRHVTGCEGMAPDAGFAPLMTP